MLKRAIRGHIVTLFLLSSGGLLIHLKIHSPAQDAFNWFAILPGVVTTFAVPVMFNYRRTMAWAYLLNLSSVVIGTVTMAWFSATHWHGAVTPLRILIDSTLADILILWAKLYPAYCILRYWRPFEGDAD